MKLGAPMLCLLAAAACGDSQTQCPLPVVWPQDTVLALDSRPILASEIDDAAGCIALLEPRDSIEQLRRLALTNVVLPRCAAQAIDPDARAQSQRLAEQCKQALDASGSVADPLHGPQLAERKGKMLDLGLELWNAAMPLEAGQWTPVVETAGCFHVARLKEKGTAMLPGLVELTLESYDFPYLPAAEARSRIEAQLDRSQLSYIDESWRAFVPLVWQHRLRGGTP